MDISSAAYEPLSPANLDNFTNPLRLPGDDGVMGILDASNTPLRITTGRESVEVLLGRMQRGFGLPRRAGRQGLRQPDHQGASGDGLFRRAR